MNFFSTFLRKFKAPTKKTSNAELSEKNIWSHDEKPQKAHIKSLPKFTEKRKVLRRQARFIGFQRGFFETRCPRKVACLKVNKSTHKNPKTIRCLQKQRRITEYFRKELF
ncbi:uncharacterized protein CELE_Y73F8A.36 [Caenorhabditis elegans]|uniref:Uncharacterized protein n=1 Tax=Caenorhabditis elegans TaxID=6239 RepID=Q56VX6_CAEEL|nr:Uncharacterized protein CELE_Y73F8A.36 [Caenorhabditis elegans]CAI79284.1 Uncharacterized protein CELE_Y73F8A.36 [Caenorhabditis elegans]|eukprot:NP_001023579.1 Uncharacterized protein CELE_Y73F8A.36 [Caenorhabditis elegans]